VGGGGGVGGRGGEDSILVLIGGISSTFLEESEGDDWVEVSVGAEGQEMMSASNLL